MRLRQMMGIGGRAIADKLPENLSVPPAGVFESFQRQHRGAFAQRQAIAMSIERSALCG